MNRTETVLLVSSLTEELPDLERVLVEWGCAVVRVTSGEAALQVLSEREIALVLLCADSLKPDGAEMAAFLRRHCPLPILFLAAGDPTALLRFTGRDAGAVDCLQLPVVPELLRAKVSYLVELRRREQALQRGPGAASDTTYRRLVESARGYAIFLLDPQGCITSWNSGAALLYGYSAKEVLGRPFTHLWRQDDLMLGDVERKLRVAKRDGHYVGEGWRVRKDGSRFWASVLLTALWDEAGELNGFGEVVKDLTAQRATETALRETQTRFHDFMDHCPALAYIRDGEGRLVYVNAAYERFHEASLADLQGKVLRQVVPEASATALQAMYQRVLREGKPVEEDHPVPSPDGSPHEWRFFAFPIDYATGERFLGGFALNVTEQRRLEEQLRQSQKMEAVGQLAGGVAHDFNNMLAVINGYTDLLQTRVGPDVEVRQGLAQIRHAGERAAALTRQLLTFSRKQVLEPRHFDLTEMVGEMGRLLGRVIGEDVRLTVVPSRLPCLVHLDPAQVEQVLMNLAVNARDAMPQGGCLTIETRAVELDEEYASQLFPIPPGPYVLLEVSDTGSGMDRATLQRIFEPFFTTKEAGRGTGLGLATVYGVVKQSGGDLRVQSAPGLGTTFRVYLPREEQEQGRQAASGGAALPLSAGTETILVVEDEEMVRGLVCHTLELGGYSVLETTDIRDAMLLCQKHPGQIHLLLTDVVMPAMSGRELAECLAQTRPGMKVLFMSGYTDDAVLRHGVVSAEAAFIQKPFSPSDLTRKVREVLNGMRVAV